jgi:hypothetical protein
MGPRYRSLATPVVDAGSLQQLQKLFCRDERPVRGIFTLLEINRCYAGPSFCSFEKIRYCALEKYQKVKVKVGHKRATSSKFEGNFFGLYVLLHSAWRGLEGDPNVKLN